MAEDAGTIRVSLKTEPPAQDKAQREDVPRIVRLLALAHRWHRQIEDGEVQNLAEIAHKTGLTSARITQIMNLRWLNPSIQTELVESSPRLLNATFASLSDRTKSIPW